MADPRPRVAWTKRAAACVALRRVVPPNNGRPFLLLSRATARVIDPLHRTLHSHRPTNTAASGPFCVFLLLLLSPPALPWVTLAGGARGRSTYRLQPWRRSGWTRPPTSCCWAPTGPSTSISATPSTPITGTSFSPRHLYLLGGLSVLNSWFRCHRNNGERFVFLAPCEPKEMVGFP